jgi:hypothetical protein
VESSCKCGTESSGSIKCWETIECPNNWASRVVLSSIELVIYIRCPQFKLTVLTPVEI